MKGDEGRNTEQGGHKIPRTNKRECPKCKSRDVQYEGLAGGPATFTGRWGKDRSYHYTCRACKTHFISTQGSP